MIEPRNDMLPDKSQTIPEIKEDLKTPPKPETLPSEGGETPPENQDKVIKTPPGELYAALQDERKKRKENEVKIAELEAILAEHKNSVNDIPEGDMYSDEGKTLRTEIKSLESKIIEIKEGQIMEKLFSTYPALKDKKEEFDEFRADYPRHKVENIAKLFLSERGLLNTEPPRLGLEKPSGGEKTPMPSKLEKDDIKRIRETQPKRYIQMLREGKIRPEDIK